MSQPYSRPSATLKVPIGEPLEPRIVALTLHLAALVAVAMIEPRSLQAAGVSAVIASAAVTWSRLRCWLAV